MIGVVYPLAAPGIVSQPVADDCSALTDCRLNVPAQLIVIELPDWLIAMVGDCVEGLITCWIVFVLPTKFTSPAYRAVIVFVAVRVVVPPELAEPTLNGTVENTTPLVRNTTLPVGVPAPVKAEAVAVKLTLSPAFAGFADEFRANALVAIVMFALGAPVAR